LGAVVFHEEQVAIKSFNSPDNKQFPTEPEAPFGGKLLGNYAYITPNYKRCAGLKKII